MRRCLLVLVLACSTPPSRPPPPRETNTPAVRTCELTGRWRDQPDQLRMSPEGATYATVFGVETATVTFGNGVQAHLRTPTLDLLGFIDPQALQLHARRPFVVADFAVPGPAFPMQYRGTRGDQLVVEMKLPGVTTRRSLRLERGCSDLRIDEGDFEPQTAIGHEVLSRTSLRADVGIPLSVEADGPPIAELRYETSPRAEVIAQNGSNARVIVYDDSLDPARNVLVFGWVPRTALLDIARGTGGSWARGGDRAPMSQRPSKRRQLVCGERVRLHVQRDRELRPVGWIQPKTIIELVDDHDPVQVTFPRAHAELADGARWLVERTALTDCITPP